MFIQQLFMFRTLWSHAGFCDFAGLHFSSHNIDIGFLFVVGTCEASRFDTNSNRTSRFEFDSKVTCWFKNFESAAHAVHRYTTNYAHSLFNKNINFFAVCSCDICLQLHLMCSCTAVARAHTQLPHDNRHWTCKRLPPDSVRDSIRIRIIAAYSIRYSIRFEPKFLIRRSLVCHVWYYV